MSARKQASERSISRKDCPRSDGDNWQEKAREVSGTSRKMRQFEGGATRDSNEGKLDYMGFISPLVLKRYAEYMHQHRLQADGSMRGSDNWKQGIPMRAYAESLGRHFVDFWLHRDGKANESTDLDIESVLCAILFNTQGYLYELLRHKRSTEHDNALHEAATAYRLARDKDPEKETYPKMVCYPSENPSEQPTSRAQVPAERDSFPTWIYE